VCGQVYLLHTYTKMTDKKKRVIAFYKEAKKWQEAYDLVVGSHLIKQRYAILAHGLELALKGVLLRFNLKEKELKNEFGHSLKKILKEISRQVTGQKYRTLLTSASNDLNKVIISMISNKHESRRFLYPRDGGLTLPELSEISNLLESILDDLHDEINHVDF
jgi:hypothetical protein